MNVWNTWEQYRWLTLAVGLQSLTSKNFGESFKFHGWFVINPRDAISQGFYEVISTMVEAHNDR